MGIRRDNGFGLLIMRPKGSLAKQSRSVVPGMSPRGSPNIAPEIAGFLPSNGGSWTASVSSGKSKIQDY